MMTPVRRRLGWALVACSLGLHLLTIYAFARQPDRLAAFTVMPIWVWGSLGVACSSVAFYFLRASLSLILTGIWAVTILLGADEARVLGNLTKEAPQPGPAKPSAGLPVIRVATLNCAHLHFGNPSLDLAIWEPDIILLQEVNPLDLKTIADRVYGGRGDYRFHNSNGIITRWRIKREVRNPMFREQQLTIADPDGREIEVVNVHLTTAATNLQLWQRAAWTNHRENRQLRRQELSVALQLLEQTSPFPERPTLLGGDFNSPANDIVHAQLSRDFKDCFTTVGSGWGDTFQRRVPILRLDCVYATRQFTPVRCRAVTTRMSDHRIVIADLILPGS
jgi:endonuclease/exonuclease/phosphatase family metal-dependent hydrolase